MVEEMRRGLREAIHEDPIRPVAQHYEERVGLVKATLEGADREDFVAFCPTFRALERCLYRS